MPVRLVENRNFVEYFFALVTRDILLDLRDRVVVVRHLDQVDFIGKTLVGRNQLPNQLGLCA